MQSPPAFHGHFGMIPIDAKMSSNMEATAIKNTKILKRENGGDALFFAFNFDDSDSWM